MKTKVAIAQITRACPLSSSCHERMETQYRTSDLFAISERIQISVTGFRLPVELEVELTDTIEDVKFTLSDKKGVPGPDQCYLTFRGQFLMSGMVHDYPIQTGSTLASSMFVRGV